MTTIEEFQQAIITMNLSKSDCARLRRRLIEYFWEEWDQQIEVAPRPPPR